MTITVTSDQLWAVGKYALAAVGGAVVAGVITWCLVIKNFVLWR